MSLQVGLAGRDYCIVAADTRLSEGYIIHSRNISRIYTVTDGIVFAGSGCLADIFELSKVLQREGQLYEWDCRKKISVEALATRLSTVLYNRRTFPYYSFSILGGISKHGYGALYSYDAVGSFERLRAVCVGKGEALMQPMLDELTKVNSYRNFNKLIHF